MKKNKEDLKSEISEFDTYAERIHYQLVCRPVVLAKIGWLCSHATSVERSAVKANCFLEFVQPILELVAFCSLPWTV
jgi:hypothetical protein